LAKRSSQSATKDGQAGDLSFAEWYEVLVKAFEQPGEADGYKSRRELAELSGLSNYALGKRLEALIRDNRVEVGKVYRRGVAGLVQRVYAYKLKKEKDCSSP